MEWGEKIKIMREDSSSDCSKYEATHLKHRIENEAQQKCQVPTTGYTDGPTPKAHTWESGLASSLQCSGAGTHWFQTRNL